MRFRKCDICADDGLTLCPSCRYNRDVINKLNQRISELKHEIKPEYSAHDNKFIPKTLKIGGHQYKVIFPYKYTERFDRWGDIDDTMKIIKITGADGSGDKRAESSITVTFIHEILHAIDYLTGHKQFNGNEGEKRIEALSEGIYQVIVDNPELKDLFTDNSKTPLTSSPLAVD